MSESITFTLSADHARALIALGSDHTAPALARAACDLVWQQLSGPAPVTDAPARKLQPVAGKDYSSYDHAAPIGRARAQKLAALMLGAGTSQPLSMARALTGRNLGALAEITEREGMQLLHIQQARAAAEARRIEEAKEKAEVCARIAQRTAAADWRPDPRASIEEQGRDWLGL